MNKDQVTALASEATKKASAFWTAFKEKSVELWKSGSKGKAICFSGTVGVLMLLGLCGGGCDGSGRDEKYTGEYFYVAFKGEPRDDEGVIYNAEVHRDVYDPSRNNEAIKIIQATRKGNLVKYERSDRTVWVETPGKNYEDGQTLGEGFYVRRGLMRYTSALGVEHTVARYVEVTDKATLKKIQEQIAELEATAAKAEMERKEAQKQAQLEAMAKAKAEAEAKAKAELEAEGQPFEVNAPVKSLCGFAIGATPSSLISLFKPNRWRWTEDRMSMHGELASPFRYFDMAKLVFHSHPRFGGKHLARVLLYVKDAESMREWKHKDIINEIRIVTGMLENKFGIEFKIDDSFGDLDCTWRAQGGSDCIPQAMYVRRDGCWPVLEFESAFISPKEEKALKEAQRPKPVRLSVNAGSNQL